MKTTTKHNNSEALNEANKYYNERINLAHNIIVAILCQAAPKYRSVSRLQPKSLKLKVSAPFRACPAALREFVSFCGKRNEQKDEGCKKPNYHLRSKKEKNHEKHNKGQQTLQNNTKR